MKLWELEVEREVLLGIEMIKSQDFIIWEWITQETTIDAGRKGRRKW